MKKLTAEDPETRSANVLTGNIDHLKTLFPEAFTEGGIDFDVLKQLLGGLVDEREEKYGFTWHGKRQARQLALTPSNGTLRPCPEDSVEWETTQNLLIEGDNLEVLKLLQKSYSGKVKLIYIDPPYNTGKDFVYPDNFRDNIRNYLELTGQISDGRQVGSNTESSGRLHTNWLNMMYPRLKVARNLLREDGVLFVSVDDNEVRNLRALCDELFSETCFVAQIVVQTNKGGQDYLALAKTHEYLVAYSKAEGVDQTLFELPRPLPPSSLQDLQGPYEPRELRNRNPRFHRGNRPNLFYPFYVDESNSDAHGYSAVSLEPRTGFTIEAHPRNSSGEDGCWRWGKPKASEAVVVGDPGRSQLVAKKTRTGGWNIYEKSRLTTEKAKTIWDESEVRTEAGTRSVREILASGVFDHPKPVDLLRKVLQIGCMEGIVMDFFAGSGTTAHAVFSQNATDHADRRWILVQLPEPLDAEGSAKGAADFCDSLNKPRKLSEIAKERLRRVSKRISAENPLFSQDLGFRVFKLDSSNIRVWDPDHQNLSQSLLESVEHLKTDRTEMDILYELLLKLGLDLCVPIERKKISGKEVHSIGGGVLLVCLADAITPKHVEPLAEGIISWHTALAPAGETTCVFRDSAFSDDVAKTNLTAILNQHGLANVRSL